MHHTGMHSSSLNFSLLTPLSIGVNGPLSLVHTKLLSITLALEMQKWVENFVKERAEHPFLVMPTIANARCERALRLFVGVQLLLPPANEVWGKVMFLHLSVSHSVHSGHRSGRYASYWNAYFLGGDVYSFPLLSVCIFFS